MSITHRDHIPTPPGGTSSLTAFLEELNGLTMNEILTKARDKARELRSQGPGAARQWLLGR